MPGLTQAKSLNVFDTDEWLDAWSRSTVERYGKQDLCKPPLYLTEYSPFWHGYEIDLEIEPVWDRPVLTLGSVYAVFGPSYLAESADAVGRTVDEALELSREVGSGGFLVFNLSEDAARRWAATREPDARVRLDLAYHRCPGTGQDPVMGDVSTHVRTEWRRRWRRATEKGLRLVEESSPSVERIDEVLALANGSAIRHDWPQLYDRTTASAVLAMPGSRLIRADWHGRTVAGFVALEHGNQLHLWAGGMDHEVVREVSPYLFLLHELLAMGRERGWERIEFGRGNDEFKRRYGFTGVELWSLWYAADPADAAVRVPRLAALHEGLARCQGL
ncbi:GNAT family N-acetyltransferase [Amycolatopsis sp. NBC_00345]|uniref:GNAT family N-acetyltransferase n=1 Tax=Amycolatopsis sp. NBC_00345 TaxID=2975955 RepID=UPI002E257098